MAAHAVWQVLGAADSDLQRHRRPRRRRDDSAALLRGSQVHHGCPDVPGEDQRGGADLASGGAHNEVGERAGAGGQELVLT